MMYLFNNEDLAAKLAAIGFNIIRTNNNPKLTYGVMRTEELDMWLKSNYDKNDLVLSDIVCF